MPMSSLYTPRIPPAPLTEGIPHFLLIPAPSSPAVRRRLRERGEKKRERKESKRSDNDGCYLHLTRDLRVARHDPAPPRCPTRIVSYEDRGPEHCPAIGSLEKHVGNRRVDCGRAGCPLSLWGEDQGRQPLWTPDELQRNLAWPRPTSRRVSPLVRPRTCSPHPEGDWRCYLVA